MDNTRIFGYSTTVALGYIPLGIAFGILFNGTGYPPVYAILMGIIVFAGSAQFLAITLLLNHASILNVFLFTLLLNSRHVFYSIHTFNLYKNLGIFKRLYLMFSLTDETFSIISTLPHELSRNITSLLRLSILNHCWWVLGCTIGAVLGNVFIINIDGLDFALVALFVVLLVEQFYQSNKIVSVVIAIISSIISFLIFGGNNFLISSIGISLTIFIGYKTYARLVHS